MKKILALVPVLFVALIIPLQIEPAHAVTCPTVPLVQFDANGTIQPQNLYITIYQKNNPKLTTACLASAKTYWETQNTHYLAQQDAKNKNEFNRRLNSCMNGVSASFTNVGSWILSLKCIFQVSFFPTSQSLKNSFTDLRKEFTSRQPTSYISVSVGVFGDLVNAWPTIGNCSDTGKGAMNFAFTAPNGGGVYNFKIPCNPPSAMKPLRVLEVAGVYFGFIFFIYRRGMKFWDERQG